MGRPWVKQAALRVATADDAKLLLAWRNDEATRRSSRIQEPITLSTHMAWLSGALTDPRRLLRILVVEGSPVASVRFDLTPGGGEINAGRSDETWGSDADGYGYAAEVSIVVAPEARGHGYGQEALSQGHRALLETWPGVRQVWAVVHEDNRSSRHLFERVGYLLASGPDDHGWLSYRRTFATP